MAPRISLVTLGVRDMARSRAFYEALGYAPRQGSGESVTFLAAGGTLLGLYGRAALAGDAMVLDRPTGFAAVTLAENLVSPEAVDQRLAAAVRAGATLLKEGQETFWGGYGGYFADPDGHIWEIAYNPFWPLGPDGEITLPPLASNDT